MKPAPLALKALPEKLVLPAPKAPSVKPGLLAPKVLSEKPGLLVLRDRRVGF